MKPDIMGIHPVRLRPLKIWMKRLSELFLKG